MITPTTPTAKTKCHLCLKVKVGRYTRPKTQKKSTTGFGVPMWYCYACLPAGQGRDETSETTQPPVPQVVTAPSKLTLEAQKGESEALLKQHRAEADALEVIDEPSYQLADVTLGRAQAAVRAFDDRMEKIIRPLRTGLDELYAFKRDVDKPFEAVIATLKGKMREFKLEEQRQLQAAERARQAEIDRLERERQQKQADEEAAKTKQMKTRLANQVEEIEQQMVEVEERAAFAPLPVVGQMSSTRRVKKWRVTNLLEFYLGVVEGTIPIDAAMVNTVAMNAHLKNEAGVEGWPGVEVYEDVQIVGR